jgi:hypothetical protein
MPQQTNSLISTSYARVRACVRVCVIAPYRIVLQRGNAPLGQRVLRFVALECGGAAALLHVPPYALLPICAPFVNESGAGLELHFRMPSRIADAGLSDAALLIRHDTFRLLQAAT